VEVKIGIQMAPRELVVETAASPAEIERALRAALADGMVFAVTSEKGGTVLVPADKIAYVEFDVVEPRKIGFASA
jgi:hypothetical protein